MAISRNLGLGKSFYRMYRITTFADLFADDVLEVLPDTVSKCHLRVSILHGAPFVSVLIQQVLYLRYPSCHLRYWKEISQEL